MRFLRCLAPLLFVACGPSDGSRDDAGAPGADGDTAGGDAGDLDAMTGDAATDDATAVDAAPDAPGFPSVLDVEINCRNDCVLVADPSSIVVPEGTSFQVNWINTGDTECDVAKIDQFNHVPILIGLEPGTSYHDTVHDWCGTLFTGTFDFRISICTLPSYIPVDCGG